MDVLAQNLTYIQDGSIYFKWYSHTRRYAKYFGTLTVTEKLQGEKDLS